MATRKPRSCSVAKVTYLYLVFFLAVTQSFAMPVRGVIRNATNGQLSSGDQVSLMVGKEEIASTQSDANGKFTMDAKFVSKASVAPVIVRVVHDGVLYQQTVRLGVATEITVYEHTNRIDGLSEYLRVLQFEGQANGQMRITELHAIQNDSWPRSTVINADGFNLLLSKRTHDLSLTIMEPDGQGAKLSVPDAQNGDSLHKLAVPFKPGLTKYAVSYEMPYSDKLYFQRSAQYATAKTYIVLPQSMRCVFPKDLEVKAVPDNSGAQVHEIDSFPKSARLTFAVSGVGVLNQAFRQIGVAADGTESSVTPSNTVSSSADTRTVAPPSLERAGSTSPTTKLHSSMTGQIFAVSLASVLFLLGLAMLIKRRTLHSKIS